MLPQIEQPEVKTNNSYSTADEERIYKTITMAKEQGLKNEAIRALAAEFGIKPVSMHNKFVRLVAKKEGGQLELDLAVDEGVEHIIQLLRRFQVQSDDKIQKLKDELLEVRRERDYYRNKYRKANTQFLKLQSVFEED